MTLTNNAQQPHHPATGQASQSKRILIVENDEVNRWLATHLLEQKGYFVSAVTDGQAAIAACAQECFDLILLDLQFQMPDGLATATALRQQETATTPIIAFATEPTLNKVPCHWKAGINCYLSKPIQTEEFYRRIEAVLKLHTLIPQSEKPAVVFDCEEALARIKGNVEILQDAAQRFFSSSLHLVSAMRRAITKDDPYNLDFAAHRLKGTASNLSAHQIVALAERLELMGSIHNLCGAQATVTALEQELARFKAAFESKFPPFPTVSPNPLSPPSQANRQCLTSPADS
ncbi:MAG: response regulator [Blastocatellia bacterium]|nr:response regulator [Blastocatellia bacterium]